MTNPNYSFSDYTDNWSNWSNQFPNIPVGVNGDLGFAVPKPDGTFDTGNYPISPGLNSPAQPGSTGLAIGGWTASQPGGGLYSILKEPLNPDGSLSAHQKQLIQSILDAAKQNGYTNIVMDYENYENPPADPAIYTAFLHELGQELHGQGMTLEIAISPNPENQRYYDLDKLAASSDVDHYQVMCYDYALGQGNPVTVSANSGVADTKAYLEALQNHIPLSKMTVGVAFYGVSYKIAPGMSLDDLKKKLHDYSLQGSYSDPNVPTVSNDAILKDIGDWKNPNAPWSLVDDGASPPNYFYYNGTNGTIYSAVPPQSVDDFSQLIKENFAGVAGFFAWDADTDRSGSMMQRLVDDFIGSAPPPVQTCVTEILSWLDGLKGASADWVDSIRQKLENDPPRTIQDLTDWLNQDVFAASSGQDVYMKGGLLLSAPSGNIIDQLHGLFSRFTNLLTLDVKLPQPTFADTAYAQSLGWQSDSEGGKALRDFLIQEIGSQGSSLSRQDLQAAVSKLVYQQHPEIPSETSAEDKAMLTAITGVWI